ncbi:MAG: WD40 repeat domain-containing protein [Geitlerinemataceae cyanobacterium]
MDWTSPLRSQQVGFIDRLTHTLDERAPHSTGLLAATYDANDDASRDARSQLEQLSFDSRAAGELRAVGRELILQSDPSLPVRELLLIYLREQLTQMTLTRALGAAIDVKQTEDYLDLERFGRFDIDLSAIAQSAAEAQPLRLRVLLCEGEQPIESLSWPCDRGTAQADLVVCLWIREPVTERGNAYRVVLAGFLPKPPRVRNEPVSIAIGDLLYIGGLPYWLEASAGADIGEPEIDTSWFQTLTSASNYVYPFALGADGRTIASSSYDGSLRIWTTENTELIASLAGPVRSISPASTSSGSHSLSTDTADKNMELWRSGSALLAKHLVGHPSRISAVTLSPSSKLAIVGCDDGSIAIWDVETGQSLRKLPAHRTSVKALVASIDETLLVSSATDRTLKVWELATGELRFDLECSSDVTIALSLDSDRNLLVSGSQSGRISIWDLTDGSLQREIAAHAGVVQSLTISPDGQQIASASVERTIKLWDLTSGDRDATLTGHPTPLVALAPQSGSQWLDLSLFQHQQPGW